MSACLSDTITSETKDTIYTTCNCVCHVIHCVWTCCDFCDIKNPCDAILEKSDYISSLILLSNSQCFLCVTQRGNSDFTHQSPQFTGLGGDHCTYEKSFVDPQGADKLRKI